MHDILNKLHTRYAVKMFDNNKKISESDMLAIEESLILTASGFNLQPWKFIIVRDQKIKKQLRENSWNQPQIEDCDAVIVLCGLKKLTNEYVESFISELAKFQGTSSSNLDGYKNMMLGFIQNPAFNVEKWVSNQVYIALGNLLTTVAAMNIDSCPMEGFNSDMYDEILGLKDTEYRSIVVCPVGYASKDDKYKTAKKFRFSKESLISIL